MEKKTVLNLKLWPIITLICILIYKRFLIPYNYPYMLGILSDVILLIIIFVLSIKRNSRIARIIQAILALFVIAVNWLDICVFLALYNRLTFDNFMANISYLSLIPQFISTSIITFTIIVTALILIFSRITLTLRWDVSAVNYLCYIALFISIIAYTAASNVTENTDQGKAYYLATRSVLATDVTDQTKHFIAENYANFTHKVQDLFDGAAWKQGPQKNVERPNILIDLSESLSAVDSQYSGGLYNRMPKIDKLLKDGLVLKNIASNGGISAQGLAALVLGVQTINTQNAYEMLTSFPPDKFSGNSIVSYAKAAGYRTIALTVNPSSWTGVSSWFRAVGFDEVYDRESSIFSSYHRYTWDAPDDEAMYTEALKIMARQKGPYLLLIETLSLHLPYILPEPENIRSTPLD